MSLFDDIADALPSFKLTREIAKEVPTPIEKIVYTAVLAPVTVPMDLIGWLVGEKQ